MCGSLSPFLALCVIVSRICVYLFSSLFFSFFGAMGSHFFARGILVSPTGGRTFAPVAPALGAWSLNHGPPGKSVRFFFFNLCRHLIPLIMALSGSLPALGRSTISLLWLWSPRVCTHSCLLCPFSLLPLCVHLFPLCCVLFILCMLCNSNLTRYTYIGVWKGGGLKLAAAWGPVAGSTCLPGVLFWILKFKFFFFLK